MLTPSDVSRHYTIITRENVKVLSNRYKEEWLNLKVAKATLPWRSKPMCWYFSGSTFFFCGFPRRLSLVGACRSTLPPRVLEGEQQLVASKRTRSQVTWIKWHLWSSSSLARSEAMSRQSLLSVLLLTHFIHVGKKCLRADSSRRGSPWNDIYSVKLHLFNVLCCIAAVSGPLPNTTQGRRLLNYKFASSHMFHIGYFLYFYFLFIFIFVFIFW